MNRVSLLLVASLVACGGSKPNQKNLAPLPPDKPVEEAKPESKPEQKPDVVQEAPKPLPPLEVTLEQQPSTIKLVNGGKGKKAPLKYAMKQGTKQNVEVALSYAQLATQGDQSQATVIPTIVLKGDAETKAVDASGKVEYTLVVSATDARAVADMDPRIDLTEFKQKLTSLNGLIIAGSVDTAGIMANTKLWIEKPLQGTAGAVDIIKTLLPQWPLLPKEPVGVGAKWQATSSQSIMGTKDSKGVEMTQVTNYELVAKNGANWTIKSTTTITGKDQELRGGKISGIGGTGTSETKVVDGVLFPTTTSKLETKMTVPAEDGKPVQVTFTAGGTLTPTP